MRKLLARTTSLAARGAVYEVEDGLEVETSDHYEIARQRVLYSDVALVTLHRRVGWAFVLINIGIVTFFAMMGALMLAVLPGGSDMWVAAGVFASFGSPFLVAALLRLAFRVDEVTVWGRRSQASLRYTFRKGKAQRLFEELAAKVRAAQEQLRAQYDAEAAAAPALPPVVEAPPMPPPASPPE
jgi:hypothetical protein